MFLNMLFRTTRPTFTWLRTPSISHGLRLPWIVTYSPTVPLWDSNGNSSLPSSLAWQCIRTNGGLVKQCLRKSLARQLIVRSPMETLVTEIEAVVNSRPLTYVYADQPSGQPLTPANFLLSRSAVSLPTTSADAHHSDSRYLPGVPSSAEQLLQIWKKGQKLLDHFWTVWQREYLLSLRERHPSSATPVDRVSPNRCLKSRSSRSRFF